MPPEIEILCCCARTQLSADARSRLERLLAGPVDWDELRSAGRQHGLLPLVDKHLSSLPDDFLARHVPAEWLGALREYFHGNSLRAHTIVAQLLRVARRLESDKISSMFFKGVALAQAVYGDVALRQPGDIDLIVQREDALAAIDSLKELEFRFFQSDLTRRQLEAVLHFQGELAFYHPGTHTHLDLHWRLSPKLNGAWERRETLLLRGQPISVFSQPDRLVYLCLHGNKHAWERLKWLCDVGQLLSTAEALDWQQVQQVAGQRWRKLWPGLLLAQRQLGSPLPQPVSEGIHGDPDTLDLVSEVERQLGGDFGDASRARDGAVQLVAAVRGQRVALAREAVARDNLRARLESSSGARLAAVAKEWTRQLCQPQLADIREASLPRLLLPLYYPLRAGRMASKAVRGVREVARRNAA